MDHGAVRNLEQIQESDDQPRTPRAVSIALVVLGGACLVFAGIAVSGRKSVAQEKRVDPLGDLVAQQAKGAGAAAATQLSAHDVTFPGILSDDAKPTTALAAVRPQAQPASAQSASALGAPNAPPPATDRLPVVTYPLGTPTAPPLGAGAGAAPPPQALMTTSFGAAPLPAQNVLEATPVVTRPRDALTRAATDSAQIATAGVAAAPPGHEGGYQLQVSSFRDANEANQFVDQLRARGHKAYVLEAHVVGRGTWYRVRVGPFATQQSAAAYRSTFESKEHVVPFIVPPKAAQTDHVGDH